MIKFLLYCIFFGILLFLLVRFIKKRKAAFYLGLNRHLSIGISAVRFFALAAAGIKVSNLRISPLVSRELNNFREEKYEKAVFYRLSCPFGITSVLLLRQLG